MTHVVLSVSGSRSDQNNNEGAQCSVSKLYQEARDVSREEFHFYVFVNTSSSASSKVNLNSTGILFFWTNLTFLLLRDMGH